MRRDQIYLIFPPQWQLTGSQYSIVPIFLTLLTTTKGLLTGNNLLGRLIPLRNPLGSHEFNYYYRLKKENVGSEKGSRFSPRREVLIW